MAQALSVDMATLYADRCSRSDKMREFNLGTRLESQFITSHPICPLVMSSAEIFCSNSAIRNAITLRFSWISASNFFTNWRACGLPFPGSDWEVATQITSPYEYAADRSQPFVTLEAGGKPRAARSAYTFGRNDNDKQFRRDVCWHQFRRE